MEHVPLLHEAILLIGWNLRVILEREVLVLQRLNTTWGAVRQRPTDRRHDEKDKEIVKPNGVKR